MATHDVRNLLKLNLLLDKACLVLRQLFKKSWKIRFGLEWSGTEDDINMMLAQLQMKNIGKPQHEAILTGDVNSWDLTTLQVILTSKDFLNLTAKDAWNINYLTNIRNKVANSASKVITDDEFNSHWRAAVVTLVEFGESEADLELLKQEGQDGVEIKKEKSINDESILKARRLKEAGNMQFQNQNWSESIKLYTEAILLPGIPSADRATLHSNRSVAFLRQEELSHALEDAEKTIELRPEWWRGHYRMGQVYTEMNNYKKAIACFDQAYAREPHHEEIWEAKTYAQMKQGQLDNNDAIDLLPSCKSLDQIMSDFERRMGSQVDAVAVKNLLHAEIDDPVLQNWQDCQKGNNCEVGVDGFPRDYGLAAHYYKKAADRGSAAGLYELAFLTMEGKGVKRDTLLGIRMLQEVAGKPPLITGLPNPGVADAEHVLGLFYQDGIGVSKDEIAAKEWYTRAWEHGSIESANNMGVLYMKEQNFIKAEQYFKMSANAGHAKAMMNLAAYYYNSQFNPESALEWCQRARNAGMVGPEIDDIEKACKDAIHEFSESGQKELLAQNAEKSKPLSKERGFRPALSDPWRANLTKRLRRLIATPVAPSGAVTVSPFPSCKPTNLMKSASSLTGLKAITLHEMDKRQDKVYNGYVLTVTIIEDILFLASMQTIIEDSASDVLLCSIYNWQDMQDRVKARKEFGIGRKISIINPYMRMAFDGQSMIRVDDPASIIFQGFVEKMCRYCCEPNASKACAKCKASYCGKECQMLDWKRDHKLICGRLP